MNQLCLVAAGVDCVAITQGLAAHSIVLLAAKSRRPLQTSIGLELVLALLIIVLTATLTTVTGPP